MSKSSSIRFLVNAKALKSSRIEVLVIVATYCIYRSIVNGLTMMGCYTVLKVQSHEKVDEIRPTKNSY
jgi:hypothetical protein